MANSLSSKKRIRQNAKCRARNRWRKTQIKEVIRAFDESLEGGNFVLFWPEPGDTGNYAYRIAEPPVPPMLLT